MNLNEAAEIVRTYRMGAVITNHGIIETAEAVIADTMLSELDPTPISKEWLRENGWIEEPKFGVYLRGNFSACETGNGWSIGILHNTFKFQTLGELRTLLRLMGEAK